MWIDEVLDTMLEEGANPLVVLIVHWIHHILQIFVGFLSLQEFDMSYRAFDPKGFGILTSPIETTRLISDV